MPVLVPFFINNESAIYLAAVDKARTDMEIAEKQFLQDESQLNLQYVNTKRAAWNRLNSQFDIANKF